MVQIGYDEFMEIIICPEMPELCKQKEDAASFADGSL